MKKRMLRTAVIIAIAAMTTSAMAQEKGSIAVGANFGVNAGKVVNHTGYGAVIQYNITDKIRVEPSYTYYNKAGKDILSYRLDYNSWECGVNVHYLARSTERELEKTPWLKKFVFYPLAGVGLMNVKCSAFDKKKNTDLASISKNAFGVNLGLGTDFKLSNRFSLNLQIKYMFVSVKFKDYDANLGSRSMMRLGATYRL